MDILLCYANFNTILKQSHLIISENSNSNSIFYGKLDLDNIGITGHSQGGAGVLTATSIMEHKDKYKTAVALSPTHEETAHQFGWKYDLTKINIPILMIAGTNGDFETQSVIPIEKMIEMYNKIPSSKVMLRKELEQNMDKCYIQQMDMLQRGLCGNYKEMKKQERHLLEIVQK